MQGECEVRGGAYQTWHQSPVCPIMNGTHYSLCYERPGATEASQGPQCWGPCFLSPGRLASPGEILAWCWLGAGTGRKDLMSWTRVILPSPGPDSPPGTALPHPNLDSKQPGTELGTRETGKHENDPQRRNKIQISLPIKRKITRSK